MVGLDSDIGSVQSLQAHESIEAALARQLFLTKA